MGKRWSDDEINYLRINYKSTKYSDIGKSLNRATKSVSAKARKLGLNAPRGRFRKSRVRKDGYRLCAKCKIWKKLSEFYARGQGKQCYCKDCWKIINRERKNKKSYFISRRRTHLKYTYNMSLEEYNKLWQEQDGKCFICGEESIGEMLHVDHNHKTGEIRRLLCRRCNVMVGWLESHKNIVNDVIKYLKGYDCE